MKLIELKGQYGLGKFAIVSDEDYPKLSKLSWYVNSGYVKTFFNRKHFKMHQLIVGSNYDHINGDKLDNRRENLRKATQQQNNANVKPRAKSGLKGVYKVKEGWRAGINVDNQWVNLGTFDNPHYAALVVDLWLKDLHGEFAYTNFPTVSDYSMDSN